MLYVVFGVLDTFPHFFNTRNAKEANNSLSLSSFIFPKRNYKLYPATKQTEKPTARMDVQSCCCGDNKLFRLVTMA